MKQPNSLGDEITPGIKNNSFSVEKLVQVIFEFFNIV